MTLLCFFGHILNQEILKKQLKKIPNHSSSLLFTVFSLQIQSIFARTLCWVSSITQENERHTSTVMMINCHQMIVALWQNYLWHHTASCLYSRSKTDFVSIDTNKHQVSTRHRAHWCSSQIILPGAVSISVPKGTSLHWTWPVLRSAEVSPSLSCMLLQTAQHLFEDRIYCLSKYQEKYYTGWSPWQMALQWRQDNLCNPYHVLWHTVHLPMASLRVPCISVQFHQKHTSRPKALLLNACFLLY